MRRILAKHLALLLFAFITIPAWSQPNFNDSIEIYNYWGKRGIVQVVYSYMQDYLATNPNASAEKRGMEAYDEKFIKVIDKKTKSEIDTDFNDLNDFLSKNSWPTTAKKIVSPLKEKLEKKQKLDSSFFSLPEVNDNNFMRAVKNIVDNYTQSLQKFQGKTPVSEIQKEPEQPLPPVHTMNKKLINYLWLIPAFILGLIIGCLFLYYYSKQKVLSILANEKDKYNRILKERGHNPYFFKFLSFIKILKTTKDKYESASEKMIPEEQVVILKQKIADLERKNNELLNENIELGEKVEDLKAKGNVEHIVFKNSNKLKTLFFSIPEPDGTFKTENAKDFIAQDCFYKLELVSKTNGDIYFLSGDYDLRAIENIDYYLNPVCEVQNIGNRASAKKVEMINHGTIALKGDSWKIDNKIKIKLV